MATNKRLRQTGYTFAQLMALGLLTQAGQVCADMCVHMCVHMCADMCIDLCIDLCTDMGMNMRAAHSHRPARCV